MSFCLSKNVFSPMVIYLKLFKELPCFLKLFKEFIVRIFRKEVFLLLSIVKQLQFISIFSHEENVLLIFYLSNIFFEFFITSE